MKGSQYGLRITYPRPQTRYRHKNRQTTIIITLFVCVLVQGKIVLDGAIEEIRREEHSWEIHFNHQQPPANLEELGFQAIANKPGAYTFDGANIERLNEALDAARAQGAQLIHLSENQRDLEQILMDLVQERPS